MADQTNYPDPAAPTLVGREREQATLGEALAASLAGHGALVLIGGEAGVGKTTLAAVLCREAGERGALVLTGHCYDLAETPPYGPWVETFAQYAGAGSGLPPLPAVVTDRAARAAVAGQAALFDQVLAWFAAVAAARPLVLVLEDLHWADPASLDLLRLLARGLAARPLLLLATYRADELTRRHLLYQLLPALVREAQVTRLDLRPLDEAALRDLVAARYPLPDADAARLVAYLRAHAEGNPFYAGELLRALAEARTLRPGAGGWTLDDLAGARVPPLLRQVIDARVARLGEGARALLAVAATIGPAVPLELWATVAGVGEEALIEPVERAAEAGLLIESADGATVRFAHALLREALYEGTAAIRRRAWHRRAGEALAATARPDPDAVAYHFRQAGDVRAGAWLVRAGERAQLTYAWVTAAERFEAALPLLPDDPATAGQRGWLLLRIGLLRRYTNPAQALAYLEAAGEAAQLVGESGLAARARFASGLVRCYRAEMTIGIAAMAEAVAALAALPPPDPAARAALRAQGLADDLDAFRATHVLWLAVVGDHAQALPLAEAVVARLPASLPAGVLDCAFAPDAVRALGYLYAVLGRPAEARRMLRRTVEAYRAAGDLTQVGISAYQELRVALLPYQGDDLPARRALLSEAREALERASQAGNLIVAPRTFDLAISLLEGRWDDVGARWSELAGRWLNSTGSMVAYGTLARYRGDAVRAWALVREYLPAGAATMPGGRALVETLRLQQLAADLALDSDDRPTAGQWLAAHDRWLAWSGAVLGRSEGQALWARYHRQAGDAPLAYTHAERALAHATEPRQPLALLAAHRLIGELDTEVGQYVVAASHLDAALALADACAAPYERALTLLALADLRAATDRAGEARALLDEARAICTPLGARPALARAERLAARWPHVAPNDPTVETPPLAIGTMIGAYRLLEHLGSGTEAAAYRARHTTLEREAAIKVLRDAGNPRHFAREAADMAALDHPNIVAIWEYGEQDGQPYVAMPFVRGTMLAERLAVGPLPRDEARGYLRQLASALDYAHGRGVVHGAIRPTTILLDEHGQAQLLDFQPGREAGATGHRAARDDRYALGLVCLAMLLGSTAPFDTDTRTLHGRYLQPPSPELRGVAAALRRALAENPAERYDSAQAFAAALEAGLDTVRSETPPASLVPFGLSVREVEVLRLVAQGLGNAEVGERLYVSPRTVQQHLRAVYTKLGVDNRTAATRFAVEHHLT